MGKHGGIMEFVFLGSMWLCKGGFLFAPTAVSGETCYLGNLEESGVLKNDAGK